MDRDVAELLRRRHDVVTRMLSNVIWSNLGTKKPHIALVLRLHGKKSRSDQIRSDQIEPTHFDGCKDTQIDPTSM
jgi:hypothetical protein